MGKRSAERMAVACHAMLSCHGAMTDKRTLYRLQTPKIGTSCLGIVITNTASVRRMRLARRAIEHRAKLCPASDETRWISHMVLSAVHHYSSRQLADWNATEHHRDGHACWPIGSRSLRSRPLHAGFLPVFGPFLFSLFRPLVFGGGRLWSDIDPTEAHASVQLRTTVLATNSILTNSGISSRLIAIFCALLACLDAAIYSDRQVGGERYYSHRTILRAWRAWCFRLTCAGRVFVIPIAWPADEPWGRVSADSYVISIPLMEGAPPAWRCWPFSRRCPRHRLVIVSGNC